MRYKYLSFPHPVLGVHDDIKGSFSVNFAWQPGMEFQTLAFENLLNNNTLSNLINQKKAAYLVEIHCPASFYRKSFTNHKSSFALNIPTDKLVNKVTVNCFIIAVDKIDNYKNDSANLDYFGYSFNIEPGEILAVNNNRFEFIAEKTFENYYKISSFMEVVPGNTDEGPLTFKLTQDKIYIEMPKLDYKKYANFNENPSLYPVFHSSLAFPALIYALNKMRDGDEDKNTAWYQKLEERLNQDEELQGFDVKNSSNIPLIAQTILKDPVSRTLIGLEKLDLGYKTEDE